MQAVSFLILCAYACDSCANIKGIFNRTHTLPWGRGKLVWSETVKDFEFVGRQIIVLVSETSPRRENTCSRV